LRENKAENTTQLQSTMIGPLWARAIYSQRYPEILTDPQAIELFNKIKLQFHEAQVEFHQLEEFVGDFLGLVLLTRARVFDDAILAYLTNHPSASIVNLGCGLDTTFSRVDNGQIRWYDLDLPNAIEFRRHLINETARSTCIPKSVFDVSWIDDVTFNPDKGIFLFAGGLFNYFAEPDVAKLCREMAERFPSGELIFDTPTKFANRLLNWRLRRVGVEGIDFKFGLNRNPARQLANWSDRIEVVECFSWFARIPRKTEWKFKTRFYMNLVDRLKFGKFAHLRFQH
jgi:O-methyltransferase involved in polyketide biosynthesis